MMQTIDELLKRLAGKGNPPTLDDIGPGLVVHDDADNMQRAGLWVDNECLRDVCSRLAELYGQDGVRLEAWAMTYQKDGSKSWEVGVFWPRFTQDEMRKIYKAAEKIPRPDEFELLPQEVPPSMPDWWWDDTSKAALFIGPRRSLWSVHEDWQRKQTGRIQWKQHPLMPIVRAWQNRPQVMRSRRVHDDDNKGKHVLANLRKVEDDARSKVERYAGLMLLVDEKGNSVMAGRHGGGLPVVLRVIEGMWALVPLDKLKQVRPGQSIQLTATVRELMEMVYPDGFQARDWETLRAAILPAYRWSIDLGNNRRWHPISPTGAVQAGMKYEPDAIVPIVLYAPPDGQVMGAPVLDANMMRLGQSHGAHARVARFLANWLRQPGNTLIPVSGRRGVRG